MEELLLERFSDFAKENGIMSGDKIKIDEILNKEIIIKSYKVGSSKYEGKQLLTLQIELEGIDRVIFTSGTVLVDQCNTFKDKMPFISKIQKINHKFYSFT